MFSRETPYFCKSTASTCPINGRIVSFLVLQGQRYGTIFPKSVNLSEGELPKPTPPKSLRATPSSEGHTVTAERTIHESVSSCSPDCDKLKLNGLPITDISRREPVTVMANHMAIKRSPRSISWLPRCSMIMVHTGVARRLLGGVGSSNFLSEVILRRSQIEKACESFCPVPVAVRQRKRDPREIGEGSTLGFACPQSKPSCLSPKCLYMKPAKVLFNSRTST